MSSSLTGNPWFSGRGRPPFTNEFNELAPPDLSNWKTVPNFVPCPTQNPLR